MRIITCASYFATGSSAVTDLFTEFDDVTSLGSYEYRFLQDPDGISDLEYNIVENNHRHNTSHAIKRYLKLAESFSSIGYGRTYPMYSGDFQKITNAYIDEITELKSNTWWIRDRIDRGNLFCFVDRGYSFLKRILDGGLHTQKKDSLLAGREKAYYSAVSEEKFLSATRKYVDALVDSVNPGNTDFITIDQMVPPTNCGRYVRYFNDVRIVVVDRDPRDVYLWEKTKSKWGVIPTDTAENYVKWFLLTRKYSAPENEDEKHIMRLKFEDMIYRYDETVKILADFVGIPLSKHIRKREFFDPARSIKNTNLKTVTPGFEKEIRYIEDHLPSYLYKFPENID